MGAASACPEDAYLTGEIAAMSLSPLRLLSEPLVFVQQAAINTIRTYRYVSFMWFARATDAEWLPPIGGLLPSAYLVNAGMVMFAVVAGAAIAVRLVSVMRAITSSGFVQARDAIIIGGAIAWLAGAVLITWKHTYDAIIALPMLAMLGLVAWRPRRRGVAVVVLSGLVIGAMTSQVTLWATYASPFARRAQVGGLVPGQGISMSAFHYP